MTFLNRKLVAFLIALIFSLTLVGCGEQSETTGEKVDAATQKAGETMEQATEQGKEMMEEAEEKLKEGQ